MSHGPWWRARARHTNPSQAYSVFSVRDGAEGSVIVLLKRRIILNSGASRTRNVKAVGQGKTGEEGLRKERKRKVGLSIRGQTQVSTSARGRLESSRTLWVVYGTYSREGGRPGSSLLGGGG